MAGKGTEIGRTFEELKAIFDGVDHPERLSVCFDTCHTHDAGYATRDDFDAVLAEFDRVLGIDKISVVHVNDSKNDLGDAKDRHANIGFGKLGFDAIERIVHHPALASVPKILETPYVDSAEGAGDKALPPYRHEIEMLRRRTFDPELIQHIRNDRS
jgi:deoxyribonuclease-4